MILHEFHRGNTSSGCAFGYYRALLVSSALKLHASTTRCIGWQNRRNEECGCVVMERGYNVCVSAPMIYDSFPMRRPSYKGAGSLVGFRISTRLSQPNDAPLTAILRVVILQVDRPELHPPRGLRSLGLHTLCRSPEA